MREWIQAGCVLAATSIALVVPPLAVAWRRTPAGAGWRVPLIALALGSASQGLLGLFWDRLVRGPVAGEIAIYCGFWIVASLWVLRMRGSRESEDPPGRAERRWLAGILAAAVLVRLLHPLGHAALGQSDAYSHLQFIRQVMAGGMVQNQVYPPAFSWIMALPAATFGLDPYGVARFGGAFWGAALVYALYALGRFDGRPWAGLCAAALAAFCPAWMPLIKTGVGVFANQFGLFLLPLILLFHLRLGRPSAFWLLMACALSLASAVPMMLVALMPVLLLDRLSAAAIRESRGWRSTGLLALALVPAFAVLGWHSAHIQGIHRAATMEIVTGGAVKSSPVSEPPARAVPETKPPSANVLLLKDFCSVKRKGYGDSRLNLAGAGLGLAFLAAGAVGLRRKNAALRLLGAWGLVTSLQAGTGLFQFTGYQREGWSLLLAAAWLGGGAGARVLALERGRSTWRGLALAFLGVCFLGSLRYPPGHAPSFSTAEDELIDVARAAADRVRRSPAELPLTVVMRPFTGFHGNQGDPLAAAVGESKRVSTVAVGPETAWSAVSRPGRQYLFLMDRVPFESHWSPGLFARVQPDQVDHFLEAHRHLFGMNRKVDEWAERLPAEQWEKERLSTSPGLEGILVRPVSK
ncbi:MAG: hypothetical protein AB7V14_03440 [Kiritimatiellia bacterium]